MSNFIIYVDQGGSMFFFVFGPISKDEFFAKNQRRRSVIHLDTLKGPKCVKAIQNGVYVYVYLLVNFGGVRIQGELWAMVSKLKVLKITQKTENCIHGTYFSASHKFTHPNVGSFVCSIHIGAGSQMIWRSCIVASKRKSQGYKRQCQSENHTHSFTLRVSVFMLK